MSSSRMTTAGDSDNNHHNHNQQRHQQQLLQSYQRQQHQQQHNQLQSQHQYHNPYESSSSSSHAPESYNNHNPSFDSSFNNMSRSIATQRSSSLSSLGSSSSLFPSPQPLSLLPPPTHSSSLSSSSSFDSYASLHPPLSSTSSVDVRLDPYAAPSSSYDDNAHMSTTPSSTVTITNYPSSSPSSMPTRRIDTNIPASHTLLPSRPPHTRTSSTGSAGSRAHSISPSRAVVGAQKQHVFTLTGAPPAVAGGKPGRGRPNVVGNRKRGNNGIVAAQQSSSSTSASNTASLGSARLSRQSLSLTNDTQSMMHVLASDIASLPHTLAATSLYASSNSSFASAAAAPGAAPGGGVTPASILRSFLSPDLHTKLSHVLQTRWLSDGSTLGKSEEMMQSPKYYKSWKALSPDSFDAGSASAAGDGGMQHVHDIVRARVDAWVSLLNEGLFLQFKPMVNIPLEDLNGRFMEDDGITPVRSSPLSAVALNNLAALPSGVIDSLDPQVNPPGHSYFLFGSRPLRTFLVEGQLHVRVGGGYVTLAEFARNHAAIEGRRCLAQLGREELIGLSLLLQERLFAAVLRREHAIAAARAELESRLADLSFSPLASEAWIALESRICAELSLAKANLVRQKVKWEWQTRSRAAQFASEQEAREAMQDEEDDAVHQAEEEEQKERRMILHENRVRLENGMDTLIQSPLLSTYSNSSSSSSSPSLQSSDGSAPESASVDEHKSSLSHLVSLLDSSPLPLALRMFVVDLGQNLTQLSVAHEAALSALSAERERHSATRAREAAGSELVRGQAAREKALDESTSAFASLRDEYEHFQSASESQTSSLTSALDQEKRANQSQNDAWTSRLAQLLDTWKTNQSITSGQGLELAEAKSQHVRELERQAQSHGMAIAAQAESHAKEKGDINRAHKATLMQSLSDNEKCHEQIEYIKNLSASSDRTALLSLEKLATEVTRYRTELNKQADDNRLLREMYDADRQTHVEEISQLHDDFATQREQAVDHSSRTSIAATLERAKVQVDKTQSSERMHQLAREKDALQSVHESSIKSADENMQRVRHLLASHESTIASLQSEVQSIRTSNAIANQSRMAAEMAKASSAAASATNATNAAESERQVLAAENRAALERLQSELQNKNDELANQVRRGREEREKYQQQIGIIVEEGKNERRKDREMMSRTVKSISTAGSDRNDDDEFDNMMREYELNVKDIVIGLPRDFDGATVAASALSSPRMRSASSSDPSSLLPSSVAPLIPLSLFSRLYTQHRHLLSSHLSLRSSNSSSASLVPSLESRVLQSESRLASTQASWQESLRTSADLAAKVDELNRDNARDQEDACMVLDAYKLASESKMEEINTIYAQMFRLKEAQISEGNTLLEASRKDAERERDAARMDREHDATKIGELSRKLDVAINDANHHLRSHASSSTLIVRDMATNVQHTLSPSSFSASLSVTRSNALTLSPSSSSSRLPLSYQQLPPPTIMIVSSSHTVTPRKTSISRIPGAASGNGAMPRSSLLMSPSPSRSSSSSPSPSPSPPGHRTSASAKKHSSSIPIMSGSHR